MVEFFVPMEGDPESLDQVMQPTVSLEQAEELIKAKLGSLSSLDPLQVNDKSLLDDYFICSICTNIAWNP